MEKDKVHFYKSCERCRSRKRGCNGQHPCQNCVQSSKPPLECIYAPIPPPAPKTESKGETCDQCRQKKRRCDSSKPFCKVCEKGKNKDENGVPICTWTYLKRKKERKEIQKTKKPKLSNRNSEDLNDEYEIEVINIKPNSENVDLLGSNSLGSELAGHESSIQIDDNIILPSIPINFNDFSFSFIDLNHDLNMNLDSSAIFHFGTIQSQLEIHLLHLSTIVLQVIPLTASDKSKLVSMGYSPNMCKALKNAMFANSVMFSTHPSLYNSPPVLKQRIDVAKGFASKAIRMVNQSLMQFHFTTIPDIFTRPEHQLVHIPPETVDLSDLVRAMLCLAHYSYGIGEGATAIRLISDVCHMSDLLGLFVKNDGNPSSRPLWSVDSLVFRVPNESFALPPQNIMEEQERFVLWASCLVFDTYCGMESGMPFSLDERMYPEFVSGWRPRVFDKNFSTTQKPPTKGDNTIWGNTGYSEMFDKVSDICQLDLYPHATSSTFNYVVWICVILRRILRVVRSRIPIHTNIESQDSWWSETLNSHPSGVKQSFMKLPRDASISSLHDSLIVWYSHLPERALAFTSLESFDCRNSEPAESTKYFVWTFAPPAIEGTFLYLSSFCYLHMACLDSTASNDSLYRISAPRYADMNNLPTDSKLFSSRQVLLIVLRALGYILKRLSLLGGWKCSVPSPVQFWPIQPLELFIIASSGLLATRISPFNEADHLEALNIVQSLVLPSLEKFCKVWPTAIHYKNKMEVLLQNLKFQSNSA